MIQRGKFSGRDGRGNRATQVVVLASMLAMGLICTALSIHLTSGPSEAKAPAEPTMEERVEMAELLVPTDTIPVGTPLDPALFRVQKRPAALINGDMLASPDKLAGMFARGVLVAGQPVVHQQITSLQPVNQLTASIPKGYRAVAIWVDSTSAVEGWAQAGARVDVLWIPRGGTKGSINFIAENAKVLSSNRRAQRPAGSPEEGEGQQAPPAPNMPQTLTLLLSNRDSLRVRLASQNGRVALVLRGAEDPGFAKNIGSTIGVEDLWVGMRPDVQVQVPKDYVAVKVRDQNSNKEETMMFEHGQRVK